MSARAPRIHPRRGFTIIEVLVALSAGVLVSAAAFMLSRNATAFFQREARISSAQLALTLGMNRLTSDIQRASFLSTPNIAVDPTVCSPGPGLFPNGLARLAGVDIYPGTATPQGANQSTPPGSSNSWEPQTPPDAIVIGGSLSSSEIYEVQTITAGSGGPLVVLRAPTSDPATNRALTLAGSAAALPCQIGPVFAPTDYPYTGPVPPACAVPINSGRFGRIYHPESNWQWYGVITTATIGAGGEIDIQLATSPAIPVKPDPACGISGVGDSGQGWLFSVVSRVRYDIRSLAAAQYGATQYIAQCGGPGVAAPVAPLVTGDSGRTELVRTELDQNNVEITPSTELVAEYAVDLRFGITVSTLVTEFSYNPTVTSYAFGAPQVQTVANDITLGGTPELIRAVQVRLSTRARAPDRDTDLTPGPDGRRLRWLVDPTLAPTSYSRVRTVYSNVALPNQGGFSKW
jgi:prepilin-type N-terminal cleavage/methylation domain-containing protein